MKQQKAFTLIELLVVIAIIGILAAIIMTGFQSAKDKARDALIKEAMGGQLMTLSVEYFIKHPEGYGGFCNDTATEDFLDKIDSSLKNWDCQANSWIVCARLYSNKGKAWCADSTGVKQEIKYNDCKKMKIDFCSEG